MLYELVIAIQNITFDNEILENIFIFPQLLKDAKLRFICNEYITDNPREVWRFYRVDGKMQKYAGN